MPEAAIAATATRPIRVMVIDDSAVVRGATTRILEGRSEIKVVASAATAASALATLARVEVDIVLLDIEMPGLDGLSALPHILKVAPNAKVIMSSTLTQRGAETSLDALRLGAIDFVPKPTVGSLFTADDFKRELVRKVIALGSAREAQVAAAGGTGASVMPSQPPAGTRHRLRSISNVRPAVIGIGSSTGGPEALKHVLATLSPAMRLPIVIAQHMPPTFTRLLADQLGRAAGRRACEGIDGARIAGGHIYVAPGGFHMVVERIDGEAVIRITSDPPENYCRPAVDPLFRSLAVAYGAATLAIVLTGMGADGARGAAAIAAAGGTVLAQDEPTSVVWGMPSAALQTGACAAIVPLDEVGQRVAALAADKAR